MIDLCNLDCNLYFASYGKRTKIMTSYFGVLVSTKISLVQSL
jgi:hypothetical protein